MSTTHAPGGAHATLTLRIAEALGKDVARGLARLDPADMARLGLRAGGAVEITGKRRTVCRAMPAHPEHRGRSRIHVDAIVRENAGAAIDDPVTVQPVPSNIATAVVLAPMGITISARELAQARRHLEGTIICAGDRVRLALLGSRGVDCRVERTEPEGAVVIAESTRLEAGRASAEADAAPRHGYEDIGGLRSQVARIREMIELPLRFPEVFARLGIDPPRGVLLHGPPGCGKTLIARTIAQESDARFFSVSGPEIVHKFYGESEAHLRKIFDEAARAAPSIIFIDEIDSIAPRRENTPGEVEKRVVAQLLALLDGLRGRGGVIVIGATNLPNNLDPALRRPGRFDREIVIPVPDRRGRLEILEIHARGMPLAADVDLARLAETTHGCVGADLAAVCREAAMACLREALPTLDPAAGTLPEGVLESLEVTNEHFQIAAREVEPSAMREVFAEIPDVAWDDVGGLDEVKRDLAEAVLWPLQHAEALAAARVRPSRGILLAGPPGVGKTLLAKAAASCCGVNFIPVRGPELLSRFVGESERAVREVFRRARHAAPCIIFFDEIDALAPTRGNTAHEPVGERVLGTLLAEMDGIEELRGVVVLAATNRLDRIDAALLRPGRFDRVITLPPPDHAARAAIFRIHLRDRPIAPDIDADRLVDETAGFSGAQIESVVGRAALRAVRRAVAHAEPVLITAADLAEALAEERRTSR